jgi:hypothetical protein
MKIVIKMVAGAETTIAISRIRAVGKETIKVLVRRTLRVVVVMVETTKIPDGETIMAINSS